MFSIKFLLFFTTAALLGSAVSQSWEVAVYEPSADGTSFCTGGGTTISGSDVGDCHEVGLGSNAASFNVLLDIGPLGEKFICKLQPQDIYRQLEVADLHPSTVDLYSDKYV
jgi:hypothetical protein